MMLMMHAWWSLHARLRAKPQLNDADDACLVSLGGHMMLMMRASGPAKAK